jgi:hypothetical protein
MVRLALCLAVVAAGCSEPRIVMKPLPELVVGAPRIALAPAELLLIPGESMIWDVHWHGLTIGRAELVVTEGDVKSRFKTGRIVSSVANVQHELTTILDRPGALPHAASERVVEDGETTQLEASFEGSRVVVGDRSVAVPGGNHAHTMHSAIGAIRAWTQPGALPGYLFLLHVGAIYRLDVEAPVLDDLQGTQAWRVDCVVHTAEPISATIWLTTTPDRTPIRIELASGAERLAAELIETSNHQASR